MSAVVNKGMTIFCLTFAKLIEIRETPKEKLTISLFLMIIFVFLQHNNHAISLMEQLLHYCWKHKLFQLYNIATTDGRAVEIIDTGLHNTNSGPDFFNAKVKIDGTMWVGNVEIHDKSSDWYLHEHDKDPRYDNVILHVVGIANAEVSTTDGRHLPQLEIKVPPMVEANYKELLSVDSYPPCYKIVPKLSSLTTHSWMSALVTERLEQKTNAIMERMKRSNGSWEDAYFITLARYFGFGINSDAFETWAEHIPLSSVAHHRDDIMQIEAFFLGQAGLLCAEAIPERYRTEAIADEHYNTLCREYKFLAHKFSLSCMDYKLWRFLRLHPQNFPQIRISQLANLFFSRKANLSQLLECKDVAALEKLFATEPTSYWQSHYNFGQQSTKSNKHISKQSINVLIINVAVPMLFAYGRYKGSDELCDRAFDLLDQLKVENNMVVRMWQQVGLTASSASDSQALIQLKKVYCDRKDCLRCRIGYEYLKAHP